MNEADVRKRAEAHGEAVVAGDLRRASEDLTQEAQAQAGAVMGKIPSPVIAATVESVEAIGDECVAAILYSGEDSAAHVESRWVERDGRPMIVDLRVV